MPARHLALAAVLLAGLALPRSGGASRPAAPPQDAAASALRDAMEAMKGALKGTATTLRAGDREAALGHLAELERSLLLAKVESPPNLDQVPEAQRAAHVVAFRKDLIALLHEVLAMEELVLDGDLEAAFAKVVDPLYPLREAAHERYQRR